MSIKTAVIGYGYWGPNVARNIYQSASLKLAAICDTDPSRLDKARKLYPNVRLTPDFNTLLKDTSIEAIAVATPVHTHFKLAKQALLHNKHIWLEKPMTSSYKEALELVDLAEKKHRILLVNHIFLYNGAIRKIKEIIDRNITGDIKYIDSTRINLGMFQEDINVLWDLASHDVAIVNYLINERPLHVQAIGKNHYHPDIENIAFLILHYASGLIAHFNCSWSSPVKIRTMLFGGLKKKIVFDDIEPSDKIKVYDSGMTFRTLKDKQKILVDYRTGDISIPKFSIHEPLALAVDDFARSVRQGKKPLCDGAAGAEVVKILELAQKSIKQNGKLIPCS